MKSRCKLRRNREPGEWHDHDPPCVSLLPIRCTHETEHTSFQNKSKMKRVSVVLASNRASSTTRFGIQCILTKHDLEIACFVDPLAFIVLTKLDRYGLFARWTPEHSPAAWSVMAILTLNTRESLTRRSGHLYTI